MLEYDGPVRVKPKLTYEQLLRLLWLRYVGQMRIKIEKDFERRVWAAYDASKNLFRERKRIIRKPGEEIQLVTFD